jgi:rubrerythrin
LALEVAMTTVQQSFERLVSLAIERETEAYEFYMQAAKRAELSSSAKLLKELSEQEVGHRKKLEAALKQGVCGTFVCKSVAQFKKMDLDRYLAEVPLTPSSSPQDVLIVAIKKEEAAHDFYKTLSELTTDASNKVVFETLAGEELKHKQRLQELYDEKIQQWM